MLDLFQLKKKLISQLLQHWSQFSSMLNILYTAQKEDRTLHMATAIIHTPFKIPACWHKNQALQPEQGAHQEGGGFVDEISVQICWFASQQDRAHC